MTCHNLELT